MILARCYYQFTSDYQFTKMTIARFSIVIPTYNRQSQLARCLASLAELRYPREMFEVIVVNDEETTTLAGVVDKFLPKLNLTLLTQPHAGPAQARNRGAREARNECLAFTDDDCEPAADWLDRLAAALTHNPGALVGGHTVNALPHNSYSAASQLLIDYIYGYYNAQPQAARFVASNNIALARKEFLEVGGFDTGFPRAAAEDREFCDRWRHTGRTIIYAPDAIIHHAHALSARTYLRQHLNYGRGAYHFHCIHARREPNGKIHVEPFSFYLDLIRAPKTQARGCQQLKLSALLLASQAANTAGYALERLRPTHDKQN